MTSDPPTERRTQQKPVHAGQNDPRTVFVCPRHLLLRYSFMFLHNQVERRVKKKKKKEWNVYNNNYIKLVYSRRFSSSGDARLIRCTEGGSPHTL